MGKAPRRETRLSCPDYKILVHPFHSFLIGRDARSSGNQIADFFSNYRWDKYRNFPEPNTIYGEGYPWGFPPYPPRFFFYPPGFIRAHPDLPHESFCSNYSPTKSVAWDMYNYLPNALCKRYRWDPERVTVKMHYRKFNTVNVLSCCPGDADIKEDGTYKSCDGAAKGNPHLYIPITADGIDFEKEPRSYWAR